MTAVSRVSHADSVRKVQGGTYRRYDDLSVLVLKRLMRLVFLVEEKVLVKERRAATAHRSGGSELGR